MKTPFDLPVWRAHIDLKLARLRSSVSTPHAPTTEHVFAVFREYIVDFLEEIEGTLDLYSRNANRSVARPEKDRSNALRNLDLLIKYMRFFETAIQPGVPSALSEHAQTVFRDLEPRNLILIRRQNHQTFETRLENASLKRRLTSLLDGFVYLSEENFAKKREIEERFESRPNIYAVSYPKYFGDVVLFYPILGHEFGHVLLETRNLKRDWLSDVDRGVTKLLQSATWKRAADEELAPNWYRRAASKLLSRWSLEFYCDQVGWHLYGEAYIYALWLVLLPQVHLHRLTPLDHYVAHLSSSLQGAIGSLLINPFEPEASEEDDHSAAFLYPAPGARIRRLLALNRDAFVKMSKNLYFSKWRVDFRGEYEGFRVHKEDPRFKALEREAERIAGRLTARLRKVLPGSPACDEVALAQRQVEELVESIQSWIPPCEVTSSPAGDFVPADWRHLILAIWIAFLEASADDRVETRGEGWPEEWMKFQYEAFDMSLLSKTFQEARQGIPVRGD